jgi:phosphoglycerate-specific signal transduction histidine kinase
MFVEKKKSTPPVTPHVTEYIKMRLEKKKKAKNQAPFSITPGLGNNMAASYRVERVPRPLHAEHLHSSTAHANAGKLRWLQN